MPVTIFCVPGNNDLLPPPTLWPRGPATGRFAITTTSHETDLLRLARSLPRNTATYSAYDPEAPAQAIDRMQVG